jgi:site-specific recombinase XerD
MVFKEYLGFLCCNGWKAATLAGYSRAFREWETFCKGGVLGVTKENAHAYVAQVLQRPELKTKIKYKRLYPLHKFYTWAKQKGYVLLNPFDGLIRFTFPLTLPKKSPNKKSVGQIIESAEKQRSEVLRVRDRAIFELAYSSGLRRCELVGLNIKDINFGEGMVKVTGKLDKERLIPVGKKALEALAVYLHTARPALAKGSPSPALFVTWHERNKRITPTGFSYIFQRRKRGITPHGLRRAFAVHTLRNGAGIQHIQRMLGHEKLETTKIYTALNTEDLKRAHRRWHPRG